VTHNDLYIEPGGGLQVAFSMQGATGWGWAMQLGLGFEGTRAPSSASHHSRFLALLSLFHDECA
jgi:hypothetical protein